MSRNSKFPQIQNLDNELDAIEKLISELSGQDVKVLPSPNHAKTGAIFNVLQEDGTYIVYKKIGNSFKRMKVDLNSFVFWE